MFHARRIAQAATLALVLSAACGCTIQDVLQGTLGGVDSDRATLNKINPSNQNSFPEPNKRAEIRWPKLFQR